MTSNPSDRSVADRLAELDAATICDVYDEYAWPEPALDPDIRMQTGPGGPLVGFAYTIEGQLTEGRGPDTRKLEVVADTPEGCVAVWSGTNAEGICLFGDGLAAEMVEHGCRGMVADGGFRDRAALDRLDIPVFARYSSPVQSLGRWRVTRSEEPVVLPSATGGKLTVRPGDWILADGDGIVAIEADVIDQVLDRAEAIKREEV